MSDRIARFCIKADMEKASREGEQRPPQPARANERGVKMDTQSQQMREVTELALRVGRERQELLLSMKAAFLAEDEATAMALARRLCGLDGDDD